MRINFTLAPAMIMILAATVQAGGLRHNIQSKYKQLMNASTKGDTYATCPSTNACSASSACSCNGSIGSQMPCGPTAQSISCPTGTQLCSVSGSTGCEVAHFTSPPTPSGGCGAADPNCCFLFPTSENCFGPTGSGDDDEPSNSNICYMLNKWQQLGKRNPIGYLTVNVKINVQNDVDLYMIPGAGIFSAWNGAVPGYCLIQKSVQSQSQPYQIFFPFHQLLTGYPGKDLTGNFFIMDSSISPTDPPFAARTMVEFTTSSDNNLNFDLSAIPPQGPGSCLDQSYKGTCTSTVADSGAACGPNTPVLSPFAKNQALVQQDNIGGITFGNNVCDSTCGSSCDGYYAFIPPLACTQKNWATSSCVDQGGNPGGYRQGLFGANACYTYDDCYKKSIKKIPGFNYGVSLVINDNQGSCTDGFNNSYSTLKCTPQVSVSNGRASPINLSQTQDCFGAPHEDYKDIGCKTPGHPNQINIAICNPGVTNCN